MSSSRTAATSPARNPRRTNTFRIAKSRRPIALRRSQLFSSRAASTSLIAFGRAVSCQLATGGTAAASVFGISPSTCRYRNRQRSRVAMDLA